MLATGYSAWQPKLARCNCDYVAGDLAVASRLVLNKKIHYLKRKINKKNDSEC